MKLHFDTFQKPIDGEQLKCLGEIDAPGRCLGESRLCLNRSRPNFGAIQLRSEAAWRQSCGSIVGENFG
jgi:hypothetical protein